MLTYKIVPDPYPEDPRELDNLSFLHLRHNRRNLGDEGEPDPLGPDDIAIPVYAYEHGGIALSLTPFSCPFDSGQIGVAIVRLEDARKEWNTAGDWSDKTLFTELVQGCVRAELDVYNTYLNGEVCGYEIITPSGEVVSSCYGYYDRESCEADAKDALAEAEKDIEPLPAQRFRVGGLDGKKIYDSATTDWTSPTKEHALAMSRYLLAIETMRALLDGGVAEAEITAQQLIDEYENTTTD